MFDGGEWYDPDLKGMFNWYTGTGKYDPTTQDRQGLRDQVGLINNQANTLNYAGGAAGGFADQAQTNYNNMTGQLGQSADYLRSLASGQNSVSAMQLQQGLQQNLAAQRSMAAGAAPQNSAMASRQAANNQAKLGYGLAGQQAMAGLQERNQAQSQLSQLLLGQRGQDSQTALGARGQQIQAYGQAAQAYGSGANAYAQSLQTPQKTEGQQMLGAFTGLLSGAAMSDRRVKKNIADADGDSKKALGKLNSYTFDYKDEKHGKGRQLGVMAQELERAGLGHTIIETREGKAVNTGRLSLANTAMLSSLHKRLSKLEGDE